MNNYKATGRLSRDPELRALPNGTAVCNLTVAVKGLARDAEVGYIDVTSFGASGEAAARVLTKGWLVAVDGRLEYHDWETQDGEQASQLGADRQRRVPRRPEKRGAELRGARARGSGRLASQTAQGTPAGAS